MLNCILINGCLAEKSTFHLSTLQPYWQIHILSVSNNYIGQESYTIFATPKANALEQVTLRFMSIFLDVSLKLQYDMVSTLTTPSSS